MQAKDLIVLGSSRLLGKLYCGDVDIGGSASISTISSALSLTDTTDSSSTTTGALKVSGGVGIAKKLYVGGNTYHSGATYFGSTYNISSSGQATLSQVKVGTGSGDTTITNNSATIANISSSEITNSGKITTSAMDVNGKLHAVEYDLENIVDLGGSFIVAPTLMLPVSNATSSNANLKAKNSGTTTLILTIKDPSITSGGIAGFAWSQNYKVKVSGQINNVVLGTLSGYLNSAANISSNTLNITLTSVDSAIVSAVGPSTSDTQYNLGNYKINVMLYNTDTSSTSSVTKPIGIFLQHYDLTNNPIINIWNGASTVPKVRLGYLAGITYNGSSLGTNADNSWGLYSNSVFLEGNIIAKGGKIGGWTIGDGYITSNSNRTTYNATTVGITIDKDGIGAGNGSLNTFYLKHSDGSMMVKKGSIAGWRIETTYLASGTATAPAADTILLSPSGTSSSYNVGGKNQSGWVLTAGTTFGVDKTGGLYATSAHITGEITATALKIGSTDYLNDIQDISNKASSTSLTTEINQRKAKYGTQSATSTDATSQVKAITCSNFELVAGNEITVYFKYANTYASGAVQLNVNSKGAKNIWVANAVTSTTNKLLWGKDAYITFRYNGSAFIVIGEPRIWYGACSTSASANAKTDTTAVTGCVICKGTVVNLAMTNENTGTAPTLNIQSTGALALYAGTGTTRPLASNGLSWSANTSQDFVFDGVQWRTADSGSAARSKALSDAAAKTATNCITEISNAGIWVTPSGKKPDANGDVVVDSTTGTLINADGVGIYKAGTKIAQYGDTITLGQETSGSFRTKIDSDTFWITNGTIDIAYIGNGNEITDTFISDGTTMEYELSSTYSSGGVFNPSTISGTKKSGENKIVISSGLPEEGGIFTYTYMPSDPVTYYTMGYRTNDSAVGIYSFVEGHSNIASGKYSHAEGWINTASGSASHVEGSGNTASGKYSHAEGGGAVQASGDYSHAEGNHTEAKGKYSHAEGTATEASGVASHAEGYDTTASGLYSHTEGIDSIASSRGAHAEGYHTTASGLYSHAEACYTTASGDFSHAQNYYTIAQGAYQTAIGKYNIAQGSNSVTNTDYAFIIGNGTSDTARSNALTVDWSGGLTTSNSIWAKKTGIEIQNGVDGSGGRLYMYSNTSGNSGMYYYNTSNTGFNIFYTSNANKHIFLGASTVPLALWDGDAANKIFMPANDNNVHLGATSYRWKQLYAVSGTIYTSDLKQKSIINDFDWKIDDFIKGLKPIAYKWIKEDGSLSNRIKLGFGAQDVAKLAKELNIGDLSLYEASILGEEEEDGIKMSKPYHGEDIDDSKLIWSLKYSDFIAPMVLEIQRLMDRVDKLEKELQNK